MIVTTEAAKDGKQDSVRYYNCFVSFLMREGRFTHFTTQLEADVVLVAVGRQPYIEGLSIEVDSRGHIVIDNQFNTSVPHIKCIGDMTFGPMLMHKAEEEGIAAAEHIGKDGSGPQVGRRPVQRRPIPICS